MITVYWLLYSLDSVTAHTARGSGELAIIDKLDAMHTLLVWRSIRHLQRLI